MGKRTMLAVLTVGAFLIGGTAGWRIHAIRAERDERLMAALNAVGVAGLCANALRAARDGRAATVQDLLEMRMVSAVDQAADRVGNASSPDQAIPNLIEGLKRARSYAVEKGMTQVVEKCDHVLEFLTKSSRA
jgi:hypothetical protein